MPIALRVEAQADERSFKQVSDRAESYFTKAGKEASGSFSKAFGSGAKDSRKAWDAYAKTLDDVADAAGKATVAEKKRLDAVEKATQVGKKAEDLEKKLKTARDAGDTKAVASAERQLTQVREQQTRATTAVVRSAEAAAAAKRREHREVRQATSAYRDLQQSMTPARQPGFFSGLGSQSSGVVGQFQMLGGSAGKAFVGGAIAALAVTGLVEAGKKAATLVLDGFKSVMETGIDFSKTVNNFQGVTGATAAQTKQMSDYARALGADTTMAGVTAADAAKTMTALARAGFDVDNTMTAARGSLQLATAAQIDAAQAAEIQANAINMFNMNASDAGRVADIFANAAKASSATMPGLAQALGQAGSVAAGFGMDLNETISILSMFDKAGIKGSDAGTLWKTTLQSMTKAGEPAQRALQALNMDVFDNGKFVGPREFIRQLEAAKNVMNDEEFLTATNQLFGTDAMRTPMVATVATFDEILAKTYEVGSAAQMAGAQMQGWPGVVEGIDNSVEALKLSFYDLFNTPGGQELGNKIVDSLSGAVDWVNAHKPELLSFVAQVGDAAMAVGDSLMGMTQVWLQTAAMLSDGLAYTIGSALEVLMKTGNWTGKVLSKIPGIWGDVGRSIADVTQDIDDAIDGWQSAGGAMRYTAAQIGPMRNGLNDLRDGFKESMADTIAAEEANRSWGNSFDDVKSSLEQIPNSKEMLIKENTDEVRSKLEQLGFEIQSLPDGRQVIRVEYRDASGNPIAPQMIGSAASIPVTVPPPTGGVLGSAGAAIVGAPSTSGGGLFGSAGAASPRSAPTVLVPPPAPAPPKTSGPGVGGILGPGGILEGGKSGGSGGSSSSNIAVPYGSLPELMPGVPMTAQLFSAQTSVADARTKVAELEAKLNALRADNTASANDIVAVETDLAKARREQQEAEMRFQEAQLGSAEKGTKQLNQLTSDLGEVGASIDQDFGISKGLAGIAENITKFIANLAMAPLMGPLAAIAKANPTQGGHGLMGMLGAQGVFGSQYQNNQYAGGYAGGYAPVAGSVGASMYGIPAGAYGIPSGANVYSGPHVEDTGGALVPRAAAAKNLISQMFPGLEIGGYRAPDGYNEHSAGEALDIMVSGAMGDQINDFLLANAEALGLQYNIWEQAQHFPDGRVSGMPDRGSATQNHFDHVHARFKPGPLGGGSGGVSMTPYSQPMQQSAAAAPASTGSGLGMGVGPGFAPAPASMGSGTRIGGLAPVGGSGKGGVGIQSGGLIDMAIQAGGMGLDMMAPGAGQAAQLGIKLGARAAEYAGQAAGIGVQGLMETFLPTGGSELANSNWLTRIAGGIAGAAPALPNMAGKGQGGQLENPNGEQGGQQGQQSPGMNIEKLEYNNNQATEDRAGKDLTYHLGSMYAAPGM